MKCPKCNYEMELGTDCIGEWGHECHNCGCIVCQKCGRVFASVSDAEIVHMQTGKDYYCPTCDTRIYSVDLYGE